MTPRVTLVIVCLLLTLPAWAGTRSITCYLDGGVVSQAVVVVKGYAEVLLPGGMLAGTLRVKPQGEAVIAKVQTVPAKVDPKAEKALASLDERRDALGDRLKALEVREEIFTAAAKSQSAKAPRKSKTNPEPVTAIKQGTDFALTRLEEVYRARRATEKELKGLDVKRAELARKANVGGSIARIWLQGKSGSVTVEYAVTDAAWKPVYDLRLDGTGTVVITLRALLPEAEPSTAFFVVPARLTSSGIASGARLSASGEYGSIATYTLPVVAAEPASPLVPLALTLTNATTQLLPSGDASCYWKGEFWGTVLFPGLSPGDRKELVCGRPAPPDPATPDAKR